METNDLVVGEMVGSEERFSTMSLERLVDRLGFRSLATLPKLKKLTVFWLWSPTCWMLDWMREGTYGLPSPGLLLEQLRLWVETNASNKFEVALEEVQSLDED